MQQLLRIEIVANGFKIHVGHNVNISKPERVAKLVVCDALLVLQASLAESERLHLQLVSCHVVLQCHALLLSRLDVIDEFGGESDVAVVHLDAIVELHQFQILSKSDETHLVAGNLYGVLAALFLQFGESYAAVYGSTSIHHLLRLKRKRVAEVGLRESFGVGEVAVGHEHVAVVACRQRGVDVGQALALGLLHGTAGYVDARLLRREHIAAALNQTE